MAEGRYQMALKKEKFQLIVSKDAVEGPIAQHARIRYRGNDWTIVDAQYRDDHGDGLVIERELEVYAPDHTYEQLLEMEKAWEEAEEQLDDEDVWLRQGIELYKDMRILRPEEPRLQYTLAKLLLQSGTSAKRKRLNRSEARDLFKQLLEIEPGHPLAHYHMGYLHWYDRKPDQAAQHFHAALQSGKLMKLQRIRAYSTLALCSAHLRKVPEAQTFLDQAWEEDSEREHIPELELVGLQIRQAAQDSQITCAILLGEDVRIVPYEEAEPLTLDAVEQGAVVLDLFREKPVFSGPLDTVRLQPRLAALLGYLMRHTKPRSAEEISNDLWEGKGRHNVRPYIRKLREAISPCMTEPVAEVIASTGKGYVWMSARTPLIIQNDDPRRPDNLHFA